MFKKSLLIAFMLVFSNAAECLEPKDFAKYFEVDMDEKFPDPEELAAKYMEKAEDYNPKYAYRQEIGNIFDKVFRATITHYGTSEKRIKSNIEDDLYDMLQRIPKEYYPYVGPFIHVAKGIPEKIKNMPGIKETKNKFPERIAPQLADLENLEFLSPHLYILLMPEIWPENIKNIEYQPKEQEVFVKANIPDKMFDKIDEVLPEEEFYPDREPDNSLKMSDLQTVNPTKDSPLTSGDINAFASTLDKIHAFSKEGNNFRRVVDAGYLINFYEQETGRALPLNSLKDMVNPCQRLIQRVRMAGLEKDFLNIVSQDGFDLNGWAYTCDKTIKAYRKIKMDSFMALDLKNFKEGTYNDYMRENMSEKSLNIQFSLMQGTIEMHKAPIGDCMEVMKNYNLITDKFKKSEYMIFSAPLSL